MTPADSPALAALTAQSPDGGRITFSPRFHLPAYEVYAARHEEMVGVVAEADGQEARGLVGAAQVSFGECQYEGVVRPYALLSGLVVHPAYRRQGIASALAQWRIERADRRFGKDALIFADIQTGNVGSTANAKKWANFFSGRIVTAPANMRAAPPPALTGVTIREAADAELEGVAESLNRFYRDYNFYRPQTAGRLREWRRKSPLSDPLNRYLVAVDSANRLLAGMGVREEGRLLSLYIEHAPALIRFANRFLKVIPADKEMRPLQAEMLWFAPGQLEAGRTLWQTARWLLREQGSSLLCNFDPRSPIRQMIQNPFWMPTTSVNMAVRAPAPLSEARLIDPLI